MTLNEYYVLLANHDWFYQFSDDDRAFRAGRDGFNKLKTIAFESPEHQKLFEDWTHHVFSGPSYKTEKQPKPVRPE